VFLMAGSFAFAGNLEYSYSQRYFLML